MISNFVEIFSRTQCATFFRGVPFFPFSTVTLFSGKRALVTYELTIHHQRKTSLTKRSLHIQRFRSFSRTIVKATHSSGKPLFKCLTTFLCLKLYSDNMTNVQKIFGLLQVAKVKFIKGRYHLSVKCICLEDNKLRSFMINASAS